jgi:hypothetical protein
MITYTTANRFDTYVYLDGKLVGCIAKVDGGYQYIPDKHDSSWGGDVLSTLQEVKASLEED